MGGQCDIPDLPRGTVYVQASAGADHTVLLCSDGKVVAVGGNDAGQCEIPALRGGRTFKQVYAGAKFTLYLFSDGSVVASGLNDQGQCSVPRPPRGAWYVQVDGGAGRAEVQARAAHEQAMLEPEFGGDHSEQPWWKSLFCSCKGNN